MMNRKPAVALLAALAVLALSRPAPADNIWELEQSSLTYHVTHPLHEVIGTSHEARGKGVCRGGECDFLIAVPVKSFGSGDTNRDLHMIQAVRGGEYPMVVVRTKVPESATTGSGTIHADLEIQFAGQTVDYKQVALQVVTQGNETKISGTIPATVSDFKIDPPKLLAIPIKNDIPVEVQMTWRRM